MTIAEALNLKLAELKITQAQLAKELSVQPALVSMLVSGKRKPTMRVARAIYRWDPDLADVLLKE